MYTIIYLKKPTSFSSDFALALSICLCFYFCNICIHVGIYCCLMSHTSMITSEISHRFGRVQLMKSFIVFFFFFFMYSFFSFFFSDLALPFLRTKYQECFNTVPALWPTVLRLVRVRMHLLKKEKSSATLSFCSVLWDILVIFRNRCSYYYCLAINLPIILTMNQLIA